jgi:hypothetical protein
MHSFEVSNVQKGVQFVEISLLLSTKKSTILKLVITIGGTICGQIKICLNNQK